MKRNNTALAVISTILIIMILWGAFSYKEYQDNLIKGKNNEINQFRQELENCNNSVDNLTQQLKVKEGTCGIDIQNMASELEGKNEYLAKIDKAMTSCLNDSDCTRVNKGCCDYKALNLKYSELWTTLQSPTASCGCAAVADWRFALCENNMCVLKSVFECNKEEDCKSYDAGCLNEELVYRSNMSWYFKSTNKFNCSCSPSYHECTVM